MLWLLRGDGKGTEAVGRFDMGHGVWTEVRDGGTMVVRIDTLTNALRLNEEFYHGDVPREPTGERIIRNQQNVHTAPRDELYFNDKSDADESVAILNSKSKTPLAPVFSVH